MDDHGRRGVLEFVWPDVRTDSGVVRGVTLGVVALLLTAARNGLAVWAALELATISPPNGFSTSIAIAVAGGLAIVATYLALRLWLRREVFVAWLGLVLPLLDAVVSAIFAGGQGTVFGLMIGCLAVHGIRATNSRKARLVH